MHGFGGGLTAFDGQRRAWPEFSGLGAPPRTQPVQVASFEVATHPSLLTGFAPYRRLRRGVASRTLPPLLVCRISSLISSRSSGSVHFPPPDLPAMAILLLRRRVAGGHAARATEASETEAIRRARAASAAEQHRYLCRLSNGRIVLTYHASHPGVPHRPSRRCRNVHGFGGVLTAFDGQRRAWPEFSGLGAPARTQPVQLASLEVVTQSSSFTGLPQYVSLI